MMAETEPEVATKAPESDAPPHSAATVDTSQPSQGAAEMGVGWLCNSME